MLVWKSASIVVAVAGSQVVTPLLQYMDGKVRKLKYLAGPLTALLNLRVYRTSEIVVDIASDLLTASAPLLPCDATIRPGDILNVGVADMGAGAGTYNVAIGYEESE